MTPSQVRQIRATRVVGVLDEIARILDAARPKVHRQHRLDSSLASPGHKLVEAELIRLDRVPGQLQPPRSLGVRTHPVLPPISGDEIAARVTHDGRPELPNQIKDVAAESVLVGGGMAGLVDAGVDTPAHVLHEAAEQPPVD